MSLKRTQQIIFSLFFLMAMLCVSAPSHAAPDTYAELVQRNLELREQLEALDQKYAQLENERNVLIGHVRNLQQERENLAPAREEVEAGRKRYSEFQKAIEQANEKLGFVTKERDKLREELAQRQGTQEEIQSTIKTLESEKAGLEERIAKLNDQLDKVTEEKDGLEQELSEVKKVQGTQEENQAAAKSIESQKAALSKQLEEVSAELKKSRSAQKDLAIERAFLRAQETELFDRNRAALAESDRLKAEVQRLTKINEALKDAEQKWKQAQQELEALRSTDRKQKVTQKRLETKLAKLTKSLNILSREAENKLHLLGETQKDLKARQALAKEHEALIRKLTGEKSSLEAKLLKQEERAARAPAASPGKGVLPPAKKQLLDMHFNLAVAYDKTGMYREEEREYLECLKIDPDDANVHYNLGILYDDKLNNNSKAIRHYTKYLQLAPAGEETKQVEQWVLNAEQQERL